VAEPDDDGGEAEQRRNKGCGLEANALAPRQRLAKAAHRRRQRHVSGGAHGGRQAQ
jgi:hypothetical protein